ncbi:MAG: iron-containing alcohol dehydrogenase [Burkholderiales bacterium]|nr:iron-containing alcohol dehydrogenase [Burkholderiales bacterium]
MTTTLNRLLAGTMPDADAAGMLTVPVRSVVIGHDLAAAAATLVAPLEAGERIAVIHDPATRAAMGAAVVAALSPQHEVTEVLLPIGPQPDADTVAHVRAAACGATMLVAVGSGTVNDLTKYAAHCDGKPYVVFGTAPSMNGYTSVSAAITEHGHKKSLPASAPRGVFLDLDVLAAAPPRLIAAGFGDSICRPTAQADWLLSHLLLDTAYRETPFRLLAEDESALIASAAGLRTGDRTALELLARTLVLSGFGMTLCGGSYPASQGEHLISHYLDMLGDPAWPTSFHGEHIAVTTLTMARLQTLLLSRAEPPTLRPTDDTETAFIDHFGSELGAECWSAFAPKRFDADTTAALTDRLHTRWPEIRARIDAVMRPVATLDAALNDLAAPRTPEALGVPRPFYRQAVLHARRIRDRFTMLDLAALAGLLPAFVADA